MAESCRVLNKIFMLVAFDLLPRGLVRIFCACCIYCFFLVDHVPFIFLFCSNLSDLSALESFWGTDLM